MGARAFYFFGYIIDKGDLYFNDYTETFLLVDVARDKKIKTRMLEDDEIMIVIHPLAFSQAGTYTASKVNPQTRTNQQLKDELIAALESLELPLPDQEPAWLLICGYD